MRGAPSTAYIPSVKNLSVTGIEEKAIEVVIKGMPFPPDNLPWQDLIDFRNDLDTRRRLRALRLWINERATDESSLSLMSEKLSDLISDYRQVIEKRDKKFLTATVSSVITIAGAATAALLTHDAAKLLAAIKAPFDVRNHLLQLSQDEINARGREVSYCVKVEDFVSRR